MVSFILVSIAENLRTSETKIQPLSDEVQAWPNLHRDKKNLRRPPGRIRRKILSDHRQDDRQYVSEIGNPIRLIAR